LRAHVVSDLCEGTGLRLVGPVDLVLCYVIEIQFPTVGTLRHSKFGNDHGDRLPLVKPLALIRHRRPPNFFPAAAGAEPRERP
jgi:hypothetical protein